MASEVSSTGSTRRWGVIRRYVLARDKHICYLCGKRGADSVDHAYPRAYGGTDDLNNLKAAHLQCNRRKGTNIAFTTPTQQPPRTSRDW
jgi:5-methylcytosine-specific restriction endonuclease McrA